MHKLCNLAALTGTALLIAAAQPHGAAAQSSERHYTYSVRITDPANPGRQQVQQYRMPRELADQMYALGFLLRVHDHQLFWARNPDLLQSIDESEMVGVRLPLGIELVGGTFPGSPLHTGYRGGDSGEGDGGEGGGAD